jgi:ectoine hydroxylase-related dioxygenase (phytanoyl-CoA dioxygenase family)
MRSTGRVWLRAEECRLEDYAELVSRTTTEADCPHAAAIRRNVPKYDMVDLATVMADPDARRVLQAELAAMLADGPGIVVLARAFTDHTIVDAMSAAFDHIIADERRRGVTPGDHYAKPGANERVWNAVEKVALSYPEVFVDYYANDAIALVAEAWLGPGYQVTSQVNVVNPGGEAQQPHRDYHLGFLTDEVAERYPAHVHRLSPVLTLQGAVAHCDMPVESGPTLYQPYSQLYEPGYLAWRRPEFKEHFAEHHVQLPLAKGDAVFFNPALFHAAGSNTTIDIRRMANLLQISSAFGRAMENVDRQAVVNSVYPALLVRRDDWSPRQVRNALTAAAEGYAFPDNLDNDQPIGGLSPPAQLELVASALAEGWPPERLAIELETHAAKRWLSH